MALTTLDSELAEARSVHLLVESERVGQGGEGQGAVFLHLWQPEQWGVFGERHGRHAKDVGVRTFCSSVDDGAHTAVASFGAGLHGARHSKLGLC